MDIDIKMVKEAKKGSDKAFQTLMQMEKRKLYRTAYLYVKNENDALDIFQETVYQAYISIHSLKKAQYFQTWVTRILINKALDFLKKQQQVIPFATIEEKMTTDHESIDTQLDLLDAVDRLENRYKTVIILRYYRDYTVKQIADAMQCPIGTVKTHLHRAIQQLRIDVKKEDMK